MSCSTSTLSKPAFSRAAVKLWSPEDDEQPASAIVAVSAAVVSSTVARVASEVTCAACGVPATRAGRASRTAGRGRGSAGTTDVGRQLGDPDAEVLVDGHDLAAGQQPAVDQQVRRLTG